MKKCIILFSIAVVLVLALTHAQAQCPPSPIFSDTGRLLMEVASLGTLGSSQVAIAVHTQWPSPTNFGLSFKSCYPPGNDWGYMVLGDDFYWTHGKFGIWEGNGSVTYAVNPLGSTWSESWSSSPPDLDAGAEPEPLDQR